jgi:hypothetical protein
MRSVNCHRQAARLVEAQPDALLWSQSGRSALVAARHLLVR